MVCVEKPPALAGFILGVCHFITRMKKVELLLPAGNWESLKAAVKNGADAVYFGINRFNARIRATNFSIADIPKVVEYCHQNGVRAYCTMNTLIKNHEIKDYFNIVKALYLANIDAVIIQHFSFLNNHSKR